MLKSGNTISYPVKIFFLLIFILSQSVLFAQKTDVIIMNNGDHITGEIKWLEYGMLSFKTDDMGTLKIKWDKIKRIISDKYFEVDLQDGRAYYGSLDTTDYADEILIRGYTQEKVVLKKYVVLITRLKSSFWDILDGYVKLGFNYAKGTSTGQFNFGSSLNYRTKKYYTTLTLNSVLAFRSQEQTSRKQDLTLSSQLVSPGKWLVGGSISAEQNTELGIKLRASILAGGGYIFIIDNSNLLLGIAGLNFNRESYTDTTSSIFNLEGVVQGDYKLFIYDTPKTSLTTSVKIFPGITNFGRIRGNFDIEMSWEIIVDVYWDLTFYFSFDNKPTENASSTDYGINTAFKYNL